MTGECSTTTPSVFPIARSLLTVNMFSFFVFVYLILYKVGLTGDDHEKCEIMTEGKKHNNKFELLYLLNRHLCEIYVD